MLQSKHISVPELLTKSQVAEYFQVSIGTVNNWVKYKYLPAYSVGGRVYFKACELENVLTKIN